MPEPASALSQRWRALSADIAEEAGDDDDPVAEAYALCAEQLDAALAQPVAGEGELDAILHTIVSEEVGWPPADFVTKQIVERIRPYLRTVRVSEHRRRAESVAGP